MTPAQRDTLTPYIRDLTCEIRTVEYPAYPDGEARISDPCVKVVYKILMLPAKPVYVDYIDGDGNIAATRHLDGIQSVKGEAL